MSRSRHRDRGSGTVLTATVAMCLVGATFLAVWAIGWTMSVHRAGRAADLAAISAARAIQGGRDGCTEARRVAARNGAEVTGCTLRGEAPSFVVVVRARTELRPGLPGGRRHATGEAAAGPG